MGIIRVLTFLGVLGRLSEQMLMKSLAQGSGNVGSAPLKYWGGLIAVLLPTQLPNSDSKGEVGGEQICVPAARRQTETVSMLVSASPWSLLS